MADGKAGRPVLVTGASKGIGRAVAVRLAADGFPVTIHYGTDAAGAEATQAEIAAGGGTARLLGFDVRDRAAAAEILKADIKANDAYWGIVVNAGIARDSAFPALSGEDWDDVVKTSLDGFFNVVHPLTMPMIRRRDGGRIIAMSSVSGLIGNRGQVNYSAAKAGVNGAVKALAVELAKRNITVNSIAPGIIATAMTSEMPPDLIKTMVPMRRAGTPEEVAGVAAFLMSDDAAYVTRQVLTVNGGLC